MGVELVRCQLPWLISVHCDLPCVHSSVLPRLPVVQVMMGRISPCLDWSSGDHAPFISQLSIVLLNETGARPLSLPIGIWAQASLSAVRCRGKSVLKVSFSFCFVIVAFVHGVLKACVIPVGKQFARLSTTFVIDKGCV